MTPNLQEAPTPPTAQEAGEPSCHLSALANATPGEVRCPVCHQIVPPEHIGYKLHCRRCGYLESCCNPI
ncbi:MAG TPA: hypothetical protein VKU00_08085 [Chthonomonadaceae bacterium]|nr:hypothetical protein [Chthonomonadaceae bacterium]